METKVEQNSGVRIERARPEDLDAIMRIEQASFTMPWTRKMLARADEQFGGTWRENTYPGLSCDVPSHLYTYTFEPNPEWSHLFSPGEEIQRYFEQVARTDAASTAPASIIP